MLNKSDSFKAVTVSNRNTIFEKELENDKEEEEEVEKNPN